MLGAPNKNVLGRSGGFLGASREGLERRLDSRWDSDRIFLNNDFGVPLGSHFGSPGMIF